MKIKILSHTWIIAVVGFLLTQAGFAAPSEISTNPPNGDVSSMTYSNAQGLFDLTGIVTNFSEDFNAGPGSVATISEDVGLVQSITGAITTSGTTTTVTVVQVGGNNAGTFSFPATYTLKGSVKTSKTNVLGSVVFNGKGSANNHKYSESLTLTLTLNPTTGILIGKAIGTASQSGTNGGTIHLAESAFTNSFPTLAWNLNLTSLATSATGKVAGNATVTLADAGSFPFNVKGTFSARTGTKLTLTGTGAGKGATLKVTMNGNIITGISGSLFGQKIDLSNPTGL